MRMDTPMLPEILDIQTLTDGYRDGLFTPVDVVGAVSIASPLGRIRPCGLRCAAGRSFWPRRWR